MENDYLAHSLRGRIQYFATSYSKCPDHEEFDNQSIDCSLVSGNPIVRVFALLDRRVGKRKLITLEKELIEKLKRR